MAPSADAVEEHVIGFQQHPATGVPFSHGDHVNTQYESEVVDRFWSVYYGEWDGLIQALDGNNVLSGYPTGRGPIYANFKALPDDRAISKVEVLCKIIVGSRVIQLSAYFQGSIVSLDTCTPPSDGSGSDCTLVVSAVNIDWVTTSSILLHSNERYYIDNMKWWVSPVCVQLPSTPTMGDLQREREAREAEAARIPRANFCIGDRVEITNEVKSFFRRPETINDRRGTVMKLTEQRVVIQMYNGVTVYRAPINVRQISNAR